MVDVGFFDRFLGQGKIRYICELKVEIPLGASLLQLQALVIFAPLITLSTLIM